jgi:hypothetical protein
MSPEDDELLRRAYAAFNARDLDAAPALMHPEEVRHTYAIGGGLVRRMEIEEA